MEALLPIIIQLVTGAIGGNAASGALKQAALSMVGRTIAGAIGGVGGGALLGMLGGDMGALSGIVGAVMSNMKK